MKVLKILILVISFIVVSCKPAKYVDLDEGLYAKLETNKGDILLKLEFEKTPITVANFVSLAEGTNKFVTDSLKGKLYYNGTRFYRVVPNFIIQGGDRTETGFGKPGYTFNDEFPKDSIGDLLLTHSGPGTLSMANSGPNSNGSQFFITHKAADWLDGKHTVFGSVAEGQAIVDTIQQNDILKTVEIIKVGKAAKSFDASEVFSEYLEKSKKEKLARETAVEKAIQATLTKFNEHLLNATELSSGLKLIITETSNGDKPKAGQDVKVSYAGYFEDGKLFDTNIESIAKAYGIYDKDRAAQNGYSPFTTVYGPDARLIPGFKEGLQKMSVGDKALLFIPPHLGYGDSGAGGVIPPNADLVFEIELVEIAQ
jgi:cyclophilin family peptidyl-prolyl cis-trans isomerase